MVALPPVIVAEGDEVTFHPSGPDAATFWSQRLPRSAPRRAFDRRGLRLDPATLVAVEDEPGGAGELAAVLRAFLSHRDALRESTAAWSLAELVSAAGALDGEIAAGTVPPMLAELLARLRSCRWVDLTHSFAPGIPHYVAFPDEQRRALFHFDEGVGELGSGFLVHEYRHVGQWGTHMDPPLHFARGGRAQDEIGVEEMILPLVVIDVREQAAADPDFACTRATIESWEAQHGRVPHGAFVALHTGWDARWPDGDAMQNRDAGGTAHYPGWDVSALALLVGERSTIAIGHDMTDTDPGVLVSNGRVPAETYLLEADRWQLELLAGLGEVPATGSLIVATWPKPLGGSGFPARAFAIVAPVASPT